MFDREILTIIFYHLIPKFFFISSNLLKQLKRSRYNMRLNTNTRKKYLFNTDAIGLFNGTRFHQTGLKI